jgi:hypothetical protein
LAALLTAAGPIVAETEPKHIVLGGAAD